MVEEFEAFCDEVGWSKRDLTNRWVAEKKKHDETLTRTFPGSDTTCWETSLTHPYLHWYDIV